MPTRPNQPADADRIRTLTAPDNRTGDQMTTKDNLDTNGSQQIRVDCNCSRYSRETVDIPHAVIMDALVETPDNAQTLLKDPRITATKIASTEPAPPSAEFKPVHLMQVTAAMRNQKLIPHSLFSQNHEFLKTQPAYQEWEAKYFEQLPDNSTLTAPEAQQSPEPDPDPEPQPEAQARTTTTAEPEPEETDPDPMPAALQEDPYPQGGNVAQVIKWVGTDPDRAAHAHQLETASPVPRKGVLTHTTKHLPQ